MSPSQTYSPFRTVLLREWRRMTSRRLLFWCLHHPAIIHTLSFMATIFDNSGQMENIPIGIVDQDNTATSVVLFEIYLPYQTLVTKVFS